MQLPKLEYMKKIKLNKTLDAICKLCYGLVFAMLIIVAGLEVISVIDIPGNIKLYTVQSGSMEPTIRTGSIVLVKPERGYTVGDVITSKFINFPNQTFTHRIKSAKIIEGKIFYETKGDANQAPEPQLTPSENVLGKVMLSFPLLGYPVAFAKTQAGLIFLIVIPATLIIYSELVSIKNETRKLLEARKNRKLSLQEKVELEVGEEEIKLEKWYKRFLRGKRKK